MLVETRTRMWLALVAALLLLTSCSCPQKAQTREAGVGAEPVPPPEEPVEAAPTPGPAAPTGSREPAVAEADAMYARVEGTSFKNECKSDDECHVGGCSSEVCSAEEGVNSTCEMPEAGWPQKEASCGCVSGACIWYRAEAPTTGGATGSTPGQSQPCPEGKCADGLRCVKYYGVAGPRGPEFTSCEVPCPMPGDKCPEGQACITIADGPGAVCRPKTE